MVRNSELPRTSTATKVIAETVHGIAERKGLTQAQIAEVVGKSSTYASLRLRGMRPWSTDDLDALAKCFGYDNAFGLLDRARGLPSRQ